MANQLMQSAHLQTPYDDQSDLRPSWIPRIAVLYTLFIIYGSLLPFDFARDLPQIEGPTFLKVPIAHVGVPDAMSNIALYLPFGFLLAATLQRRRVSIVTSTAISLIAGGLLSMALEHLQTMSPARIASLGDVVCNVIGSVTGALLYRPEARLTKRLVPQLALDLLCEPTAVLAGGWAIIVALTALVPLDLTFDVSLFAKAVQNAHFIPLEKLREMTDLLAHGAVSQSPESIDRVLVSLWQLRIDYVTDLFMFSLLGALVTLHWRTSGLSWLFAVFKAIATTTTAAILVTFAGLFVLSVGLDITHVLTRTVGGLMGIVIFSFAAPHITRRQPADDGRRILHVRRLILGGLAIISLYIIARQLVPFRLATTTAMQSGEWLPLQGYYLAKLPEATLDAIQKSFRFAALGTLLAWLWIARGQRVHWVRCTIAALSVSTVISILELAQFSLPGRYPAVTDVLVSGFMTTVGLIVGKQVHRWYQRVKIEAQAQHRAASLGDRILFNVEVPLPDQTAPAEQPQPQRKRSYNLKP